METKLTIVNSMLQAVGERRVMSLETGHPSVIQASQALDDHDRDFQAKGWWFNTNHAQTLAINNRGEVLLPTEALSFSITAGRLQYSNPTDKMRYVRRGQRIYDSVDNTFEINTPLVADIVVQLPIEDLPHVAASYLKHMAVEAFYIDDDGDNAKADKYKERKTLAWHSLKAEELKVLSVNAMDSPAAQELKYRIRAGASTPSNPMIPGGRFR